MIQILIFLLSLSARTLWAMPEQVDFSNISNLVLYGNAAQTNTVDGAVLRLVPATAHQVGALYSKTPQDINQFSSLFKIKISNKGGTAKDCAVDAGGDGMTFALLKDTPQLGGSAGGLGYSGLNNSFALEIDTYCNSAFSDPNSNHIAFLQNGVVTHSNPATETLAISPDFDNDQPWSVWLDYNGTTLEVRLNQTGQRPLLAHLSKIITLNQVINSTRAFIGFTAATGGNFDHYDLISWQFVSEYAPMGESNTAMRLSINKTGLGTGTVTSPAGLVSGLDCGTRCVTYYSPASTVTLTALPDSQMRFVAWSGDADCVDGVVTLNAPVNCTAEFAAEQKTVTVSFNGGGVGKISATGARDGLACSLQERNCTEDYALGSHVSLTATLENSLFGGWLGDCTGTANPHNLSISQDRHCQAIFDLMLKPNIGTGTAGFGGDGGAAHLAQLNLPQGMAFDAQGQLYIADSGNHRVRKIDLNGNITTYAGTGTAGFSGDGNSALVAQLAYPADVAVDSQGSLYIADVGNQRVRKILLSGTITTVAGNGTAGFSGDAGAAHVAQLNSPTAVAVNQEVLYIADSGNHRIRKVDSTGKISTVVGIGQAGASGDGKSALQAQLNAPKDVLFDAQNNLYIADSNNHRIRKVDGQGIINTYAGSDQFGYSGDGFAAIAARLNNPVAMAMDKTGQLYIVDQYNQRIRRVTHTGLMQTVAGNGFIGATAETTGFNAQFNFPQGIALDSEGGLYIADSKNHRISTLATRLAGVAPPTTTAGTLSITKKGTGDGTLSSTPSGLLCGTVCEYFFGASSTVTLSASVNPTNRFVSWGGDCTGSSTVINLTLNTAKNCTALFEAVAQQGIIDGVAGNGETGNTGNSGRAVDAKLNRPADVALDSTGGVYFTEQNNHVVRQIDRQGHISTFAGNGSAGDSGDDKLAVLAQLNKPAGLTVDGSDRLYIADSGNHKIRQISAGFIKTVAGDGTAGFLGDNSPANGAQLNAPEGVYYHNRLLYIADTNNHCIRTVDANGVIKTVAGTPKQAGFTGDGGLAIVAHVNRPTDVVVNNGLIYIADSGNQRIRRVDLNGKIQTYAGAGNTGDSGDGGEAIKAHFNTPYALAIDSAGHLFVSDQNNHRVRKIHINGTISTVAGMGNAGYNGEGGYAIASLLNLPLGLAVSPQGFLYLADSGNQRVRRISGLTVATPLLKIKRTGFGNGKVSASSGLGQGIDCGEQCVETYPNNARVTLTATADASSLFVGWSGDCDSKNTQLTLNISVDKTCTVEFALKNPVLGNDIHTFAGTPLTAGYAGDDGLATAAKLSLLLYSVATDSQGTVYIADAGNHLVRKVEAGIISRFAGNRTKGYSGDGGLAIAAQLAVTALAVDGDDNVYIGDSEHHVIRKVDPRTGLIITLAGDGQEGNIGNGGPAKLARFSSVFSLRFDAQGVLYFADTVNHQVRKIDRNNIISLVAGTGLAGNAGDGHLAVNAQLNNPWALAIDSDNHLYIADAGNFKVRKIDSKTLFINTFMGSGQESRVGDGLTVVNASIGFPQDIWIDGANRLFIADKSFHLVRQITPVNGVLDNNSTVSTLAGNGVAGFGGDDGVAKQAQLNNPMALTLSADGHLYIADSNNSVVRVISPMVYTYAIDISKSGDGTGTVVSGDNAIQCGTDCREAYPQRSTVTLSALPDAHMFFVGWSGDCTGNSSPLTVQLNDNQQCNAHFSTLPNALSLSQIDTVAGNGVAGFGGDGGEATLAKLAFPAAVSWANGKLTIADSLNNRIRRVDNGLITTVAGNGTGGFAGDGGHALSAQLYQPSGLAWDSKNSLYIADNNNQRIRQMDSGATLRTVVGTGQAGALGDGGMALQAQLNLPYDVATDGNGNLYIADAINDRIRKVDATGKISAVAGTGLAGFSGDGGLATMARLSFPTGLAIDNLGQMYIADQHNHRIRKVDTAGKISTVAGSGATGDGKGDFAGDGGLAVEARLNSPFDVVLTSDGGLLVSDSNNQRVRKIDREGLITTVAGNGVAGFSGDNGAALAAQLNQPTGLALDSAGNVYISDQKNHRIRRISAMRVLSISKTGAGTGWVFTADGRIGCGELCQTTVNSLTQLILIASPSENSYFAGWDGFCQGTDSSLSLSLSAAQSCQARFELSNTLPTCPDSGDISASCNAQGRIFTDVTVKAGVKVYGGLVSGTLINQGEVANLHVQAKGKIIGGVVNGSINNEGWVQDVRFQGQTLVGGTLAGRIDNIGNGLISGVKLQANSMISGGRVSGVVSSDLRRPSILENLTVISGSQLTGLVLGDGVVLQDAVTLGEGLRFVQLEQLKKINNLTALALKLEPGCQITGMAARLDLNSDLMYPEKFFLPRLNQIADLKAHQWQIQQDDSQGMVYLDLNDIRIALQIHSVAYAEQAVSGIELFAPKNIRFTTSDRFQLTGDATFQAVCPLQTALTAAGFGHMTVYAHNRFSVTHTAWPQYYFTAYPEWLTTLAAADTADGLTAQASSKILQQQVFAQVFSDPQQRKRRQRLFAAPADPESLQAATKNYSYQEAGLVEFDFAEQHHLGVLDYAVSKYTQSEKKTLQIKIIDDANQDGVADALIIYPNGDQQQLFIIPQ